MVIVCAASFWQAVEQLVIQVPQTTAESASGRLIIEQVILSAYHLHYRNDGIKLGRCDMMCSR
jgi:hypothetical protein